MDEAERKRDELRRDIRAFWAWYGGYNAPVQFPRQVGLTTRIEAGRQRKADQTAQRQRWQQLREQWADRTDR